MFATSHCTHYMIYTMYYTLYTIHYTLYTMHCLALGLQAAVYQSFCRTNASNKTMPWLEGTTISPSKWSVCDS